MSSQPAGRDEDQVGSGADLPLLLRVQAPVEYLGIASSLSPHRREIAESGSMHLTARKLAALFDAVIPQVPNLIAAYATRASEVLKDCPVNSAGTEYRLGPFDRFTGIDATSIWAAATSGASSVALHLLACFLARAFADPAHSVSAWVEIIMERQKRIASPHEDAVAPSSEAIAPISREEIREWDASARAWLRTADLAMKRSHTRFSLVLTDINVSISCANDLYADVIQSWTCAMLTLEHLLGGRPRTTTDSAALLGISSWHMYPNLLLLDDQLTKAGFFDNLFPSSCFLTIDIADNSDRTARPGPSTVSKGVHWPTVLAQHNLDGSSVDTIGAIDYRVNIDELYLMALGSLLKAWDMPQSEIEPSLNWFIALWSSVQSARSPLPKLSWIEKIAMAAKRLLEAVGQTKKEYQQLVNFGYNQGRNFLISRSQLEGCLPWFGLRHWHILHSLGEQTAGGCGIRYLRQLAKAMELRYDEAIITQISHENLSTGKKEFHQYTTAIKVPLRDHEAPIDSDDGDLGDASQDDDGTLPDLVPDEDPVQTARKGKKKALSSTRPRYHKLWEGTFTLHDEYSISKVIEEPKKFDKYSFHKNPLSVGEQLQSPLHCYRISDCFGENVLADCQAYLGYSLDVFPNSPVNFSKVFGDSTGALRLLVTKEAAETPEKLEKALKALQTGKKNLVSLESSIGRLTSGKVCPESLWQYLEGPDPYQPEVLIKPFLELCRKERQRCEPIIASLRSLAIAQSIYEGLDGATVSSSIVERGIFDAKWAELYHSNAIVSRSVVFGCIAMFDTGKLNLDTERLEEVFALSSGNSIYAASRLLSDPCIEIPNHAVSHIVGNIGRHGVSLLVSPTTQPPPKRLGEVRSAIKYEPFNDCREDKFQETSLRLDITGRKTPVGYGVEGIYDHQAFFIDSRIGVYDAGRWIANLDIPKLLSWEASQHNVSVARVVCSIHSPDSRAKTLDKFVAVDSWEEVLGTPPAIGLVRAYKNWPSRLAVSVILTQNRGSDEESEMDIDGELDRVVPNVAVLDHGDELCWTCVHRRLKRRVKMTTGTPTFLVA
ncbi:unnamed protein product [Clonostachys rosea f. rosea IK726]|uniref:Uncharacterized protein n=1 Tax=Clonostachys rosea f. rosea IK726 TaxID=1349383 RepID=A0ACA9UH25_BIOOC|nr:unnamed protein product [Clonostachys rosea f. rosea IK726]